MPHCVEGSCGDSASLPSLCLLWLPRPWLTCFLIPGWLPSPPRPHRSLGVGPTPRPTGSPPLRLRTCRRSVPIPHGDGTWFRLIAPWTSDHTFSCVQLARPRGDVFLCPSSSSARHGPGVAPTVCMPGARPFCSTSICGSEPAARQVPHQLGMMVPPLLEPCPSVRRPGSPSIPLLVFGNGREGLQLNIPFPGVSPARTQMPRARRLAGCRTMGPPCSDLESSGGSHAGPW